jgi:integrase
MAGVGAVASEVAARSVFVDYRSRKSTQTIRRQEAGLALFAAYLEAAGVTAYAGDQPLTGPALAADPAAWAGLTWGLVAGFAKWMLQRGYSVGSVNVRLSTVKTYAKLAGQAGTVAPEELVLIKAVAGYGHAESKRIDGQREAADLPTRLGYKKSEPVLITRAQAKALKSEAEDTPQGRRDRLLMCLLIDHGLRVAEVAILEVGNFDLQQQTFQFYRPKVDKIQTHELTRDAFAAAVAYFERDALPLGRLLRSSRKGGQLSHAGISVQKINARVAELGRRVGVIGLSPHDLRHYWATTAARNNTPVDRLQEAGGWNSPAIPLSRYIEPARIANEGVNLG